MSMPLFAQNHEKGTSISGKVTDRIDGSALIGVNIYIPELKEGTVTDMNGSYVISDLPLKTVTMQVSFLGHQTIIKTIDLKSMKKMDFIMKESNAEINESIVSGLSGSSLMKNTPSPISYISESDMQKEASSNIIDAISKQPGVSQITTGSSISKPVIRGLGYNRIVVVDNGIRQEGQQWGDEHGIEIDGQGVHSAEILKGPASLIYGSDAMAGVIVFHDDPILPQGSVKANASGEYQTNNGMSAYSLDLAGNRHRIVWDWRYSERMAHDYKNRYDGYVYGSRFRERAVSGLIGINRHWGYSHLTVNYYHLTPGIVEGERDENTGAFLKPIFLNGEEDDVKTSRKDGLSYGKSLPYQQVRHYKAVWENSFLMGEGSLKSIIGYQQNRRQEFEDVANPDRCGLDFVLHTINYDIHYASSATNEWKTASTDFRIFQKFTMA